MARGKEALKAARGRIEELEAEVARLRERAAGIKEELRIERQARASEDVMAMEIRDLRRQLSDATSDRLEELTDRYTRLKDSHQDLKEWVAKLKKHWNHCATPALMALGGGLQAMEALIDILSDEPIGTVTIEVSGWEGGEHAKAVAKNNLWKVQRSGGLEQHNRRTMEETLAKLEQAGVWSPPS